MNKQTRNKQIMDANPQKNRKLKLRARYALALLIIILLGLGSRKFPAVLPPFVVIHFGDALWAGMVYFGLRLIFFGRPPVFSALLSLGFSFAIETSQLYQAAWINEIRRTIPGALILGHGFLWVDFLRYSAGVMAALIADKIFISWKLSSENR